jgi:hypothetical protein
MCRRCDSHEFVFAREIPQIAAQPFPPQLRLRANTH